MLSAVPIVVLMSRDMPASLTSVQPACALQSTAHSMASDAARAARGNDALQFLEHYVLGGGTAKAGERTAGEAAGSVAHATAGGCLGTSAHGSGEAACAKLAC